MTFASRTCQLVALFGLSALLIGCGGESDLPKFSTVKGLVTLDGQPLPNATVSFSPEKGPPSAGKTDSAGIYELRHKSGELGAVKGTHTVTISTDEDGSGAKETVPAMYNKATTLTATVNDGENDIPFQLNSK